MHLARGWGVGYPKDDKGEGAFTPTAPDTDIINGYPHIYYQVQQ